MKKVIKLIWCSVAIVSMAWGCGPRQPPSGRAFGPELVEGGVVFRYFDPEASRVYVVGDFNNWSVRSDPMTDENGDGEWTLFFPLKPGVYQYKFVIDGVTWIADPRNAETVPDGFDGRNSVLRVAGPEGS
jgi:1,4-alpha-glucan branching enzyme